MSNVWVTRKGMHWNTLTEKKPESRQTFPTQEKAIKAGRQKAKELKGELIIQNKYSQIREKDSFGNDPRSIKG